jgi:2-amino-4-hydroxy-6-hydroxymethyldihydropteridine diphosphokinase
MNFGIALGSNLGDRLRNLQAAMQEIMRVTPRTQLRAVAPLYETDPVDCPAGSQTFLNTVVEIDAHVAPLVLLQELRRIEVLAGRPSIHEHHAPRTLDLDLLYADNMVLSHPDLTLPHPRLHERRFVLQPLADIRPALILPGQTESVLGLLNGLDSPEPPLRLLAREWLQPK